MKIVVLGAGLAGVASAWYLRAAGHDVTVIDRQPGAALETSFANGGQISVSHAEPWANPRAPAKVLKWLARADAPLLFRPRADLRQWRWLARFLLECLPARARRNTAALVKLGLYSRAALQELRRETGIRYDELTRGILHFYTDPREFEAACRAAELMRRLGLDREVKTPAECVAIEPALAACRARLAGGTYAASDESGDAHKFAQALARLAQARGVEFRYRTAIRRLEAAGGAVSGVAVSPPEGADERVRGDAYVVALGVWSPKLLAPLGIRLDIYPAKGYSVTMPVRNPEAAWTVSLTDDERKLVYSRLGERLRIAGTAELSGYDLRIDRARCAAILARVAELFPEAGDADKAEFWAGLRPSTPGNVPYIGRTRYRNLYLNTGHGTLGWTQACGSARALAELMSGRRPEVDFPFLL
ncbi:MAG: D-amino acid dehydrogenase [Burkholderiales bacterium]|nr:D-amino acid dehydrogenase [Burkholderiales bacterium]